jgi:rhodanese-related sulfurtransferase
LIISNPGDENESIKRLLRVGFDNIIGFLDGSIEKFQDEHILDSIQQINSENLDKNYNDYKVIDVRTKSEYKSSHLLNSINLPLYDIIDKKNILNKNEKYLVHCQTGYRSMVASSLFKKMNLNVVEIKDGFKGILNSEKKDLIVY